MRKQKTAEKVLAYLIEAIRTNLDEISSAGYKEEFSIGEAYAYVECLEIIQLFWQGADKYGLVGNIAEEYSLN